MGSLEFHSVFDGVPSTTPEIREVRLDVGRHHFSNHNVPLRIEGPGVTEVPIELPEALFEVVDLDVALSMDYLGGDLGSMTAVLISPAGTFAIFYRGGIQDIGVLVNTVYDDDTNPIDGGRGDLARFNGEPTAGTWKLCIDLEGGESGAVMLNESTLRMHYQPRTPDR